MNAVWNIIFSLCHIGSWTNTAEIVSDVSGHKKFSESGVAVYGSTVAIGTKETDDVAIYSDTGTKQDSVSVTDIKGIALYGDVLAAQNKASLYVFEKISSAWTQTASHTPSEDINNVAIYSNFIVVGSKGTIQVVEGLLINSFSLIDLLFCCVKCLMARYRKRIRLYFPITNS